MLFFFEAGFFLLAIVALALAEFWGRLQALWLWGLVSALSFAAAPIVQARLGRGPALDRGDAHFRRTLSDSWRHLNKLLLIGLMALGVWWWVGR